MDKVHVVLNPTADRNQAGKREGEIRAALDQARVEFTLDRTEGPGHATELAARAAAAGAQCVVAAGGDGTVNEVAQSLMGTDTALGIIPVGSGNDYVRALGIERDVAAAARRIARARARAVDVGRAAGRYYLNSLGMGIDGQIAKDYGRLRFLHGETGYLLTTILEIIRFRPFSVIVEADGWSYSGQILTAAVMNGPFAGGGFHLAPEALLDDGLLDVSLLGNYGRLVRFAVLPRTRDGSYLRLKRVHARRTRNFAIRADRPVPVHVDGELLPETVAELCVELCPGALQVVV
ncbi:MAG: diacylglycerol/lipid kinase family protein [Candidatus Bipolaricaulaceae bacterium]